MRPAERAVMPVIGIILLVAVAIVLGVTVFTVVLGLGESVSTDPPSAVIESETNDSGAVTIIQRAGDTIDGDNIVIQNAHGDVPDELSAGTRFTVRPDTADTSRVSVVWQQQDDSAILFQTTVDPVPMRVSEPGSNTVLEQTDDSSETGAFSVPDNETFDPFDESAEDFEWTYANATDGVYQLGRAFGTNNSDKPNYWEEFDFGYWDEEPEIIEDHAFSYTNTLGSKQDVTIKTEFPNLGGSEAQTVAMTAFHPEDPYPSPDTRIDSGGGYPQITMKDVGPGETIYISFLFDVDPDGYSLDSDDDFEGEITVTTDPSE